MTLNTSCATIAMCLVVFGNVVDTSERQVTTATAFVAVGDKSGRPVAGLKAADFRVRVDDIATEVLSVRPSDSAPAIVLIVDGYQDTAALHVRQALRRVLDLIRAEAPQALVGLMMAEGPTPPSLLHVNNDAGALNSAVGSFVRSGISAPLLECISAAADVLAEAPAHRRMILVMTSQSHSVPSTFSAELTGESVRLSGASLWALQTSLPRREWGMVDNESVLKTVTRASGGRRDQKLTWLLEENLFGLTRQMLAQYEVTFELPPTPRGILRVGVAREGVEVFAPGWTRAR